MAIAFVNGAINNGAGVTTVSVTYAPTAGNTVVVTLGFTVAVTNLTCTDSSFNPLAAGPSRTNGITSACFYYTAASGVTGFTASWTTASGVNIAVAEYSGVQSVNAALAGNAASATSATATITVTTEDNNDFIVASIVSNANVVTITVGTLRENAASAGAKLKIADNTVASAGAVTITGTLTSAAWAIVVLELRTVASGGGGGSISNWLSKAVATGVNKH